MNPEGDRDGFGSFFRDHYEAALRLAALLVGDPVSAEDVVCDVFARVYPRWRRGRIDDVSSYLHQSIVNAVRGTWRRRLIERRHMERIEQTAIVVEHASAFEVAVVTRDAVWAALRRLPPGQRQALVLRFFEDLSERDTARLLGVSVGTVKSQTARGLAALQSMLEA